MTIADQERLLIHQKVLDEMRELVGRESFLSVREVQERFSLSREKVEATPIEILPYTDFGTGGRHLKRYHPADVLAVGARMRAWRRAQSQNKGEAYLRERRLELEARDQAAIELARSMNEELHAA